MKIALIDHHDSFIYNIKAWLEDAHVSVDIINVDRLEDLNVSFFEDHYQGIILSPGPKGPADYPKSLELLALTNKPVLGICLGMQMMMLDDAFSIEELANPMHGKTSALTINHPLFKSLKESTLVARYHSLGFRTKGHPHIIATIDDHLAMVYLNEEKKRLGFQFHPESFLTEEGNTFALIAREWLRKAQEKSNEA